MNHLGVDLIRLLLGVAALLLAVLVLRLAWRQHRDGWAPNKPHPATYGSYALALALMAFLRIGHIGEAPTWDLWVALIVVALGWVGVGARVRFNTKPPRRRRDR